MRALICILCFMPLFTCAQNTTNKSNQKTIKMDLSKITNTTVRGAIEALQDKDSKKWLTYFTADAKLTDDGKPRDFQDFSKNAVGDEWFTEIQRVENDSKDIYGHLTTKQWGDFNVYFKFHLNNENKINQLDIGQAN